MINRDRLVKTFCDLARIDSPSGEEEALAIELTRRLEGLGLEVIRDGYGNLIAKDAGENPIMLSAHMDTVEPGRGVRPVVEGDRIKSDGTTIVGGDSKAGIAAILEALESVKEDGAARTAVEVVLTREEEIGIVGARNLDFSRITAREAVVWDGDGPVSRLTSSSPTYIGFDIEVTGRAAHAGSMPEKGLSAIRIAAELITKLPQGRLDSETTFNIGNVEGGSTRNTVPELATVKGEFRSINLETLDGLKLELREAVDGVRRSFPDADITDHLRTEFETYTLPSEDPATGRVKRALRSIGLEPTMKPSGGGTDGNVFRTKGISAVVVGIGDHDMHTVREQVSVPELVDSARLCEALLKE